MIFHNAIRNGVPVIMLPNAVLISQRIIQITTSSFGYRTVYKTLKMYSYVSITTRLYLYNLSSPLRYPYRSSYC